MLSLSGNIGFKVQSLGLPDRRNDKVFVYQQMEITPVATIQANTEVRVEEVRVDMADMKIESKNVELLTSVGSCVAVCLHDSVHRCGGLAHIMLPNSAAGSHESLPSKYADTAVPALVRGIRQISGKEARLSAKIAGGANMFANLNTNSLDIGGKNVRAVKLALEKHRIRLTGEDVGGTYGRRVTFNVASGQAVVRHYNGEVKKL